MSNLSQVLSELQNERNRMQREVQRLDGAIAAIGGLVGRGRPGGKSRASGPRRRLSVAARRRIAAAQRRRWAKVRAQKKAS